MSDENGFVYNSLIDKAFEGRLYACPRFFSDETVEQMLSVLVAGDLVED